jgi:tRNA(Ile)-lysidine synthase
VIVACSGGADSVALLRALAQLHRESGPSGEAAAGFLVAAHFNHALRGGPSDEDEQSVRELAATLGIAFRLGSARGGESAATGCDEASLRRVRHRFLVETARDTGARYIATAHSIDDNVETVLHHLMRGTGPAGLAGIAPSRPAGSGPDASDFVLIRPLLGVRRSDIRAALRSIDQPWREDATNRDIRYRRNWIRHQLLPMIHSQYPHAVDAIGRAVDQQRHWRQIIDRLAARWLATTLRDRRPPRLSFDTSTDPAVMIAGLQQLWDDQAWGRGKLNQTHWRRLAQTIRSECEDRYSLPGPIDVIARADGVRLWAERAAGVTDDPACRVDPASEDPPPCDNLD